MCVCMYVCMCVREREGGRERGDVQIHARVAYWNNQPYNCSQAGMPPPPSPTLLPHPRKKKKKTNKSNKQINKQYSPPLAPSSSLQSLSIPNKPTVSVDVKQHSTLQSVIGISIDLVGFVVSCFGYKWRPNRSSRFVSRSKHRMKHVAGT